MGETRIRETTEADRALVERLVARLWSPGFVVSRGAVHRPGELPGLIAERDGEPVGLLTYRRDGAASCEIVTIDAFPDHAGTGTALLEELVGRLPALGVRRIWLITTNDNLPALRFYQRRGFALVAVHAGAIEVSRRLKPSIPLVGHDGIPLRDELELERLLQDTRRSNREGAKDAK